MKLKTNKNYLPRDVSWMYFNRRILQEAAKPSVPLLERLMFLGIYSSNLDEFFRVRVATQNRITEYEDKTAKKEKEEASAILKKINTLNAKYSVEFEQTFRDLIKALNEENIFILDENSLDEEQQTFIRDYYARYINGNVSPIWFSSVKQFYLENDASIYLAVKMKREDIESKKNEYAFIDMPTNICGRFVRLPDKDGKKYIIYLDDVIRFCLPFIFKGLDYADFEAYSFKFTRDSEMDIDNDPRNGVLQKISKGLHSRKRGTPLRIVYDSEMPKWLLKQVLRALNLDRQDTLLAGGRYHNNKDLMTFPDCGRSDLKFPKWEPIKKRELTGDESILETIRLRDRFIHVPYHSFDSFLRVLQEAAINKEVKAIKTTLYRLAKNSKVVKTLIAAARNGKKVTVVIELLARFDEESNIDWSKKMQDAGIQVIFGVEGLKVHSKITLISMRQGTDIACISTGNFHEKNALTYTDFTLMTASPRIVNDVHSVFGFISRPYTPPKFKELLVSPNDMKNKFIRLINDEIRNHEAGKPAYIQVKINHITDCDIIAKLYEAAESGVRIKLLVRGNCSMMAANARLKRNIRIVGIIDRYLEHSRIFIFAAGGEEKTFIGSADWMPRNLDNRIEVITPVYDPKIKRELKTVIEYGMKDTSQGRIVDGKGDNYPLETEEHSHFHSQEALYKHYTEDEKEYETN